MISNPLNRLSAIARPRSLSSFRPGMNIHIIGVNQVVHRLDTHGKKWEKRLRVGFMYALNVVKQEARRLMKEGYTKPMWITGDLYRSIESRIIKVTHSEMIGDVGTTLYYGRYVHEGFRHKSTGKQIKGRPFLLDAANNKRDEIMRQIHKTSGLSGHYE